MLIYDFFARRPSAVPPFGLSFSRSCSSFARSRFRPVLNPVSPFARVIDEETQRALASRIIAARAIGSRERESAIEPRRSIFGAEVETPVVGACSTRPGSIRPVERATSLSRIFRSRHSALLFFRTRFSVTRLVSSAHFSLSTLSRTFYRVWLTTPHDSLRPFPSTGSLSLSRVNARARSRVDSEYSFRELL